ncbi:MAG: ribonuclease E/G [Alphaproteobacteria bacterium]|nr:ribonuclease E/G [Alphaproteobacteria bacterium]
MLIDATHEEETRVAIVDGKDLAEFDYESKVRKQLKGNIFLAKVTRVEPSLQAAFVNFGGNRHGFLPFSEIHPDYFKIPVSDREALIAEQEAELKRLAELEEAEEEVLEAEAEAQEEVSEESEDSDEEDVVEVGGADKPADDEDSDLLEKRSLTGDNDEENESEEDISEEDAQGNLKNDETQKTDEELDAEALEKVQALEEDESSPDGRNNRRKRHNNRRGRGRNNRRGRGGRANMRGKKGAEIVGDAGLDSDKPFRFNLRHKYKIQEVVKRGQIMLIQVSKEERGNKGAAVTTYLSLPGRYCVLMPNSPRGGGVSRKIGNFKDRKRMRAILKELSIPDGMSVILRTAGVSRTKAEIKRDLDYLMRLWNTIREDTLKSTAPAVINEEANLIKRSIRDLYTRDIDEVVVTGEKGYKTAKNFMKMLVPSHAKKVKAYEDARVPLFHKYDVERQIGDIGKMEVTLKSGGYLVINPTEALVSVDVNSGRATKERHIEETALKTNLEAATEVARQLRLRDLGGLVVIDFIDMEERRNNRKVENKLRDALSDDRARIQVGRISSFGLLELSRQRLNPSLTEAQFEKCPHCEGSGVVKTLDFAAISAMRALEEEGIKGRAKEVSLNVPNNVAVYILNNKRSWLNDIEDRYNLTIHIRVDEELKPSEFRIDILARQDGKPVASKNDEERDSAQGEDDGQNRRGRRRGRRGGRRRHSNDHQNNDTQEQGSEQDEEENAPKKDSRRSSKKSAKKSAKKRAAKSKKADADLEEKEEVKKSSKKSSKKSAKKSKKTDKSEVKKEKEKEKEKEKTSAPPEPSNDTHKEFEVVNEAPEKKKKGWWNRLVD